MRKLFILPMTIIIWLVGNSCQKTTADNEPPINPVLRESEVEIPIITSAQTRTSSMQILDDYYKTIRHSQVYQCGGYWRNKR